MLEPFFFGQNQTLFGIYHPPTTSDSNRAALICPPFFDDYRRFYRAYTELANALAGLGWHVLRFDYEGTGDSWGNLENISTTDTWTENINQAYQELQDISGVDQFSVVGTRLGATLSQFAQLDNVKDHLMWDPVINGKEYLSIMHHNDTLKKRQSLVLGFHATNDSDFSNFAINSELQESLSKIELKTKELNTNPALLISEGNSQKATDTENIVKINFDCQWDDYGRYYGELMTPKPVLSKIIDTLCKP